MVVLGLFVATSCRRPDLAPPADHASPPHPANDNAGADPPAPQPAPIHVRIDGPDPDEEGRWLFAETVREGATGGWAEGSFVPERNRVVVTTRDLIGFSIDFGKLAIDWDRLVVLRIDGYNSEFRRRKDPVVRFEVTPTGDWRVIEKD